MQRTPEFDFVIKQGTTFRRRIRIKVSGITQSLAGVTAQLYAEPNDGSTAINLLSTDIPSLERGISINTDVLDDHFIEILFSDENTNTITWKYALYRLDLIDSLGEASRKLKGRLILEPKV